MMGIYTLAVRGQGQFALPNPARGMGEPSEKISGQHITSAGSRMRDTVAVKKTFNLPFPRMTDAVYDVLLSFHDGRKGLGPFELRKNAAAAPVLVNVASLSHGVQVAGFVEGCAMVLEEV
jgi:hypothetical protein